MTAGMPRANALQPASTELLNHVLVGHARRWLEQEEAEKASEAARGALEL
jgi:hypothetical protein